MIRFETCKIVTKEIYLGIQDIEDGIRGPKKIRHVSVTNYEELSNFKKTFQSMKEAALKITTEDKLETINVDC